MPTISFASTGQQIPAGMFAQLLAAIQNLVEKIDELQQSSESVISTPITKNEIVTPTAGQLSKTGDQIITPNQNDKLIIGHTYEIRWNSSLGSESVSLSLKTNINGVPTTVAVIGSALASDGRIKWNIPSSVPITSENGAKNNYWIDLSGKAYGIESGRFSIVASEILIPKNEYVRIIKDAFAPVSKITLAEQKGVELHKIRFEASGNDLVLRKITLQLVRANKKLWALKDVAANFSVVYLYDGSILLSQGTVNPSTGLVIFSRMNTILPKDEGKILTVKADIASSDVIKNNSTLAFRVYSTKPNDLEIHGASGLINPKSINLIGNAESDFNLYKSVAPTITNSIQNGTRVGVVDDVIGKFTITNAAPVGGTSLRLYWFSPTIEMSGSCSQSSIVNGFKLFDGDTLVASPPSTAFLKCNQSGGFQYAYTFSRQQLEIPAGASKTLTIKANTTNIRAGVPSGSQISLFSQVYGAKGYRSIAGNFEEPYWYQGNVNYEYTTGISKNVHLNNMASDSYPVAGATLTY